MAASTASDRETRPPYPEVRWDLFDDPYYTKNGTTHKLERFKHNGSLVEMCRRLETSLVLKRILKFLEDGYDPNEVVDGWSALDAAYVNNNSFIVRILAAYCGLNTTLTSALHLAIYCKCYDEIEYFLKKNCQVVNNIEIYDPTIHVEPSSSGWKFFNTCANRTPRKTSKYCLLPEFERPTHQVELSDTDLEWVESWAAHINEELKSEQDEQKEEKNIPKENEVEDEEDKSDQACAKVPEDEEKACVKVPEDDEKACAKIPEDEEKACNRLMKTVEAEIEKLQSRIAANIEFLLHESRDFIDINLRDGRGETPFYVACHFGDVKLVQLLYKYGADVHIPTYRGYTPVLPASLSTNPELLQYYFDYGGKVQPWFLGRDLVLRGPLLHALVKLGDRAAICLEMLLQQGMKVNIQDQDGETPLHIVSRHGHLVLAKLLLTYGARIDYPDYIMLRTPLHLACYHHQTKMINLLLAAGATMDCKDRLDDPPFVSVLENMEFFNKAHSLNLLMVGDKLSSENLVKTIQPFIDQGCRLHFLHRDELMARVYENTEHVARYLLSAGSGVPGVPNKIGKKLAQGIEKKGDTTTIRILHECGYRLPSSMDSVELKCMENVAMQTPISLLAQSRLIIRRCLAQKQTLKSTTSKIKAFLGRVTKLNDSYMGRAIPRSDLEQLPLPQQLKEYLLFSDLLRSVLDNDPIHADELGSSVATIGAKFDKLREKVPPEKVDELQEMFADSMTEVSHEMLIQLRQLRAFRSRLLKQIT